MDKPHPLSCSTLTPDLPGRLTMLRSRTLHRLISCTLLLLTSLSSSGESRPDVAHGGTPGVDKMDSRRVLVLEAVKTGILSSLGMDREPIPTQKASEEELRKMYQLYREQLREMRGNSSRTMGETRRSPMSTVLFPATGELFVRQGDIRNRPGPYLATVTLKRLMWKLERFSGSTKEC